MRLLGLDWGKKRIGVALTDEEGKLAFPYRVIAAEPFSRFVEELQRMISQEEVGKIIIGIPRGSKTEPEALEFFRRLEAEVSPPLYPYNERLTTRAVHRLMNEKMPRQQKAILGKTISRKEDAYSAMIILQDYLDHQEKTPYT